MATCCKTNTCVEIVPSGCVRYTGTAVPNGLIAKQNYCDPYLNEIINLFDTSLTSLDKRVGLDKTSFDGVNNSCGGTPVLNVTGYTVENDQYYSSDVVQGLVGVICELRSRLNYLTSENINVNEGNLHWEDLKLSADFINYLRANASCISDACGVTDVLTLSDLLKALAVKICQCCS
jgi:hypothetical protein